MYHFENTNLPINSSPQSIIQHTSIDLTDLKDNIGYDKIEVTNQELDYYLKLYTLTQQKLSTIITTHRNKLKDIGGNELTGLSIEGTCLVQGFMISQYRNSIQVEGPNGKNIVSIEIEQTSEGKVILMTTTQPGTSKSQDQTTSIQIHLEGKQHPANYVRGRIFISNKAQDLSKSQVEVAIKEQLHTRDTIIDRLK